MKRKSRSPQSRRRKQSSRTRRRSAAKCKAVSRKRVCGPIPSCRYPKAYARKEILKLAAKDENVREEFNRPLSKVNNEQLCSHLGLSTRESVQFNRVIEGRKCGPEPSHLNPNVWTKNELIDYISDRKISPLSRAKSMHREDLCALVADWSYKTRLSGSAYKLPEAEVDLYPFFKWDVKVTTRGAFIYSLLTRYPDSYFFIDPTSPSPFSSMNFSCNTQQLTIKSDLISQMKRCRVRFFFALVSLREKRDNEVGKHANFLLYDKKRNEIWHYEPLRGGKYHECETDIMFDQLEQLFKKELNPNIRFTSAPEYCPNLNLSRLIYKQKHKGFNPAGVASGLCVAVNLWMIENKLAHPNMSPPEVNAAALRAIQEHEYGALNHILNWTHQMVQLRDILLLDSKDEGISERRHLINLVIDVEKNRIG
jgi:hypothetical protein